MNRTIVNATNIQAIGYDSAAAILEVEFTSGDVYKYFDVSKNLYQQFFNTSSHEQFLNDHIRYNYRYQKVS